MAISNVSGNFQPPATDSGKGLPPASPDGSKRNELVAEKALKAESEKPIPLQRTRVRQVSEAIKEDAAFAQNIARRLQFQVDEEIGVTVVKVYDRETDELIKQFPPEELINLSKRLKALNEEQSTTPGILLQEKI